MSKKQRPSIFVGQPMMPSGMPSEAITSQMQLILAMHNEGILDQVLQNTDGWLERARNTICEKAAESSATHLLFLDYDMVIPVGSVKRLLSLDANVASGLYFTRAAPWKPVIYRYPDRDPANSADFVTEYEPNTVMDVDVVGMGCCLIKTSWLKAMNIHIDGNRKKDRWFGYEGGKGEDAMFCDTTIRMGSKVLVDTGVLCGHVTQTVVTEAHYQRLKQAREVLETKDEL